MERQLQLSQHRELHVRGKEGHTVANQFQRYAGGRVSVSEQIPPLNTEVGIV